MKFKVITPEGPEYDAERRLRWEVLAKPYGQPPGSECSPEEKQSLHLIALEGKKLVGCICFHPEGENSGRVFEMAVSEEYSGKGFARQLLHALEQILIKRGIQDIYVYVKEELEDFYSKMGYHFQDNFITQMGSKQKVMKKLLLPKDSLGG